MSTTKRLFLYSFLLWLIPFFAGIALYPLKEAHNPLFDTVMPLIVTLCVVALGIPYFRSVKQRFLGAGIQFGLLACLLAAGLDLAMVLWGPMKMPLQDYLEATGIRYLIYPIVTIGMGLVMKRRAPAAAASGSDVASLPPKSGSGKKITGADLQP
jgi:hypothetical protein